MNIPWQRTGIVSSHCLAAPDASLGVHWGRIRSHSSDVIPSRNAFSSYGQGLIWHLHKQRVQLEKTKAGN